MTDRVREPRAEDGSFRDPASRVFYVGDRVYRGLSAEGRADWEALRSSGLLDGGKIVKTEPARPGEVPRAASDGFAEILSHESLPFVSYPYEWPFEMLRDAALVQLELLLAALDEGLILKDATPYNVQWRGTTPVFIDIGSFERMREGEPWVGYRQFCMLYLYPLLLQAYTGIDFQPLLRGRIDGITPAECRRLLGWGDVFRRGVLTHVILHSRLERRNEARGRDVGRELRRAGFHVGLIKANVQRLERLVRRLRRQPGDSEWSGYADACTYSEEETSEKEAFVRAAAETRRWELVWDVGANDGRYSRIAAEHAETVLALDSDHAVVDRLYRELRAAGDRRILPLVVDVADPSPALGWRGRERKALTDRGKPDLVLCLAVVHHLAITRNVPLAEIVDWLASLSAAVVVEFPTRDDEMVRRLLARKRPGHHADYDVEVFDGLLAERFEIERRESLASGSRVLFLAHPRR